MTFSHIDIVIEYIVLRNVSYNIMHVSAITFNIN